jgi:hypothetical protein
MAVKKLLSALLVAGFLASLGCGGDSSPAKDKKDAAKKDTEKKDSSKPDTRRDL